MTKLETEEPRGVCRECGLVDHTDFWPEPDLCDLCAEERGRTPWGLFIAGVFAGLLLLGALQVLVGVLS